MKVFSWTEVTSYFMNALFCESRGLIVGQILFCVCKFVCLVFLQTQRKKGERVIKVPGGGREASASDKFLFKVQLDHKVTSISVVLIS